MDLNEKIKGKKVTAVMAVALLLMTTACVMFTEESDESDALLGVDDAASFGIGFVVGFAIGVGAGIAIDALLLQHKEDMDNAWREANADKLETVLNVVDAFHKNELKNYSNIWALTGEHWDRQSELAASVLWKSGEEYSPEDILLYSGTYRESAIMLANAVNQMDSLYSAISENMVKWNQDGTYAGKMTLSWNYGYNGKLSSTDNWDGKATYVANIPAGVEQKVFLASDGYVYLDGNTEVIAAGPDGNVTLSPGYNSDLKDGVYGIPGGTLIASDRILPVIDGNAAEIHCGIIMTAGDKTEVAEYRNGSVLIDGTSYGSLSITISPKGSDSRSVDITDQLALRESLLNAVKSTVAQANNAASAVWSIFDQAGAASAYLSTLAVPDTYNNVTMTADQKAVVSVLALGQLADYWQSNSGKLTTDYTVSEGSNLLFAKGNILDAAGNKVAENVVFTPYFVGQDVTLSVGTNVLKQKAICAVWDKSEGNLSTWDGDASGATLVDAASGYSFEIAEVRYDGAEVSSVDLDIKHLEYIEAEKIVIDPTPVHPAKEHPYAQMVMILLCVLGAFVVFMSLRSMSAAGLVLGVILFGLGYFASETLSDIVTGDFEFSWNPFKGGWKP